MSGWWEKVEKDGSGLSRRERRHMEQENQRNKAARKAHIKKQAARAQELKAKKQRRKREEEANKERAAKYERERRSRARSGLHQRNTRDSQNKRGWWFS